MSKCQLSESHRVKVNRPIYINLGVHRTIEYICPLVLIALIPSIFQGNEKDQRGCLPHKNTIILSVLQTRFYYWPSNGGEFSISFIENQQQGGSAG